MRIQLTVLCVALAGVGCKKGGGTGGGGGGGGGWLVGSSGLMAQVDHDGKVGTGYDLGATESLSGIACRYAGEAWVVGAQATLLYTSDAGRSWTAQAVPTTANLRALATQDSGPVFVGGDGTFLMTSDTGATWTELGDGQARFRSIAAAQAGPTVLAISDDGALWSYEATGLGRRATFAGAHAVAVSSDGELAMIAGAGLRRSADAGATWTQLAVDPSVAFDDVRIADDGSAIAVGTNGAIATIDPTGVVSIQHVGAANLHALHVADPDATGATGYAAGDGGQILITHDSGVTWTMGPDLGRTVYGIDAIGIGHL